MSDFSVTYKKWGVLISSPIGFGELEMMLKFYKKLYGYDIVDCVIGNKLGAICLTSKHYSAQWKRELGI